jgi:hypothetical protein
VVEQREGFKQNDGVHAQQRSSLAAPGPAQARAGSLPAPARSRPGFTGLGAAPSAKVEVYHVFS